ncbi:hypothetical protein ACIQCG_01010 [Streptomyces noursei]|uniref:hypothetical protein n=1 Tax=Streptomyces noursei TaxID=1971 RepID=UPI0023B78289|nr:hypothetical protein [Streptomyces noursei]
MPAVPPSTGGGKGLIPDAKPTVIPNTEDIIGRFAGYGLWLLVLAGAAAICFGIFKLAVSDKSRNGGGAEPFKWMGGGLVAVVTAGSLISIINSIAS